MKLIKSDIKYNFQIGIWLVFAFIKFYKFIKDYLYRENNFFSKKTSYYLLAYYS